MSRVGCAGILVKDTFCGPVKALPRPGELVSVDALRTSAGGCAANVAIDLRKLGFEVDIAGCVGRDPAGETLLHTLEQTGIRCDRVVYTTKYPTSETLILLVEGEDRRYLHSFGANQEFNVRYIDRDWLRELTVFYLGGLFAMPGIDLEELGQLLAFCQSQKITTVVDVVVPASFTGQQELKSFLPAVDWFLPNDVEACLLAGQADPVDAIRVFKSWGAKAVILTLGEKGAIAAMGNEHWRCGAYPIRCIDPSGAGDAFAAGVIAGLLQAWDLPRTLVFASVLGASATRAIGTTQGVFTGQETEEAISQTPIPVTKEVLPHRELQP